MIMAPIDRSAKRNVHIYDTGDPKIVLGGLRLTNGVTNANFYQMIDILFIFHSDFSLRHENGSTIQRDDHPMQPGKYYVVSTG